MEARSKKGMGRGKESLATRGATTICRYHDARSFLKSTARGSPPRDERYRRRILSTNPTHSPSPIASPSRHTVAISLSLRNDDPSLFENRLFPRRHAPPFFPSEYRHIHGLAFAKRMFSHLCFRSVYCFS